MFIIKYCVSLNKNKIWQTIIKINTSVSKSDSFALEIVAL